LAAERGLVTKSGAWYSHQDERIGQGRENAKKYLKDNPHLTADLDAQLRRELGLIRVLPEEEEPVK
jgi:recombination protein RecA